LLELKATMEPLRKPIILVDMDSTIADYNGRLVSNYVLSHPGEPYIHPDDATDFYISKDYERLISPEAGKEIRRISWQKNFFLSLDPIPGAIDALNEMLAVGYEVYICTSPQSRFENCVDEKYRWVLAHMGRAWTDRMIVTKDKTLVNGDILVDDKPNITGLVEPSWTRIYYEQPYNRNEDGYFITHWRDWQTVVNTVLRQ
jgi:5'-nucleotidase